MPSSMGSSRPEIEPVVLTSPALAGRFLTTSTTWEAHILCVCVCVYQMCIKHNFIYIYMCVCVCVCVCVLLLLLSHFSRIQLCVTP